MKYIGINLTKEVKDFYTEKYNTLIKKNLVFHDQKIKAIKTAILLKPIYKINVIPISISMTCFTELENTILKFV